tara:strand:- start:8539 stop:8910 length:372 start_codon:yes stop_codon:yes gene_type:complete
LDITWNARILFEKKEPFVSGAKTNGIDSKKQAGEIKRVYKFFIKNLNRIVLAIPTIQEETNRFISKFFESILTLSVSIRNVWNSNEIRISILDIFEKEILPAITYITLVMKDKRNIIGIKIIL